MEFCGFSIAELTRMTSDLLWGLYENCFNFQKFIQFPTYDTFRAFVLQSYPSGCQVDHGETKMVLMPLRNNILKNFVIKIPFLHHFKDFDGNEKTYRDEIDYCRCEARNYILAKREGLQEVFAPCIKIFDFDWGYGTTPVYLMKRADINEDEAFNRSLSVYREKYHSIIPKKEGQTDDEYEDDIYDSFNDEDETDNFFSMVAAELGEEYYERLTDFCDRNCINDIHRANIGFDEDGNFLIIDYSGFGEVSEQATEDEWWDIGEDI